MAFNLILLIAYLCVTIFTSVKISKSITLSTTQKVINIVLNAFAPVLWYYLISPIIFPKDKLITRDEREKLLAKERGSRMENTGRSSTYT
ncbi:hypothetical protein [Fluviicola sp.]|uniref:hypothetical protein n=1 Tax=Fluviicola sp. TaxID=1917219 RepID=UPI0031D0F6B3